MLYAIAILLLASYINAKEMDASTLEEFQSAIYGDIMAHIAAEDYLLKPLIAQQNSSMENCNAKVESARGSCRTCVTERCNGDVEDLINKRGFLGGLIKGATSLFKSGNVVAKVGGAFGKVAKWFKGATKTFSNWVKNIDWTKVAEKLADIGGQFSNGFDSVMDLINKIGRRRRDVRNSMIIRKLQTLRQRYPVKRTHELDEETRQCMTSCNECTPFLGDQTALITEVCGDEILENEAILSELMDSMEALYNANGNPRQGTDPIVKKIEFDETDVSFSDYSMGGVYVTAVTPNGEVRYASKYRYKMQTPRTTADELAQELIDRWQEE